MNLSTPHIIREPAVAGSFYPETPSELRRVVDDYLQRAERKEIGGTLVGIIVPHAGYVYSAPVATYAYRLLVGQSFDTVILIGLSHQYPVDGVAIVAQGAFRTPLGDIAIDEEIAAEIMERCPTVLDIPRAHRDEHSLEVQLPFLQRVLPSFRIVPLLLQDDSSDIVNELSAGIAAAIRGRSAVLVGSTDLCHYPVYAEAVRSDRVVTDAIVRFEIEHLRSQMAAYTRTHRVPNLHCMMCSTGAVYSAMATAKLLGATKLSVLASANSGDVPTGGKDQVVGYMAAAMCRAT